MNHTEPPTYITISEIGRILGYVPTSITALYHKWRNDPEHPCPTPDAYTKVKGGYKTPLWLPERETEWQSWNRQRIAIGRERQRTGGRKGGQTSR